MSRLERQHSQQAVNRNVKDYGKKGLTKKGDLKKGFIRLLDNRIVKQAELYGEVKKAETKPKTEKTELPKGHENLKDFKGFGLDKQGGLRTGFMKLEDGRVISIKALEELRK